MARPPTAGPRNLREMFHYTWTWLNKLSSSALPEAPNDGNQYTRQSTTWQLNNGLENVVEDITPELGGNLDALRKRLLNALNITIPGKATAYNAAGDFAPFIEVTANRIWDFQNIPFTPPFFLPGLTLPVVVDFGGTQTIKQSMFALGGGVLFFARPTIKNDPAIPGLALSGVVVLASQTLYQADTVAFNPAGLFCDVLAQPKFECINGGTMSAVNASAVTVRSSLEVGAGVSSFGVRYGVFILDTTGAGSITNTVGIAIEDLIKATNDTDLLLGTSVVPSGTFGIYQAHEKQHRWNGSQRWKLRTITSNRTLDVTDHTILCNSASALTVTLPTAVGCEGREYLIKDINAIGVVIIATTSSQTIDGSLTHILRLQWQYIAVRSDGANWFLYASSALLVGQELLRNAHFNTFGQWTAGAGWSQAGSVLTAAAVAAGLSQTATSSIFVIGKTYRVSYQIITATAGDVRFQFTGGANDNGSIRSAVGVYSEDITITQTITSVRLINGGVAFSGTICNLSVREVLLGQGL